MTYHVSGWRPFPEIGNYLRVTEYEGSDCIEAAAMMSDGSIEMDGEEPNACDVVLDDWPELYGDIFGIDPTISGRPDWKEQLLEEIRRKPIA